jgi:signal transduction histidine kinase
MGTLQQLGNAFFGNARIRQPVLAQNGHKAGLTGRPFNLLRSFALLSLVSVIVIGVVSGIVVLRYVSTHLLQRETAITEQFIQSIVDTSHGGPIAADVDLTDAARESGRVAALLADIVHIPDVVRANVYAPNATLVWSTEKNLIGKHFEFNDELRRALEGKSASHIVRVGETRKAEHAFFSEDVRDFVEIYVPLWSPDRSRIIGVAEIYRVPHALFRALAQGKLIVFGGGLAGGLFLYAVLFWIVHRAHNVIRVQQQRLENEIGEHKHDKQTLRRSEHALHVLSGKLLGAQEQERKRIAAELHDGLGQSLSAIKFNLERGLKALEPCAGECGGIDMMQGAIERVRDAVDEVRRISMDLRPSILDDLGILATIEWFCREFQQVYPHIGIDKRITVTEGDVSDILKIVIYRIMQEAFNNVAKHASADRIVLVLAREADTLRLSIGDNGRGFSPQVANNKSDYKGVGMQSMRERTELSGGELRIDTRPGEGTTIEVRWRLRQSASDTED